VTGLPDGVTPTGSSDHVAALVQRVDRLRASRAETADRSPVLVCVDGRSGSGKTTLARRVTARLRDGGAEVRVLHLDHVYPGWDGLSAASILLGERLLPRLAAGGRATYPTWSWVRDRPGPDVVVDPAEVVLVEGVGSGSRVCRAVADLVVWLEAPQRVRHARAMARDGESYAPHWQRWAAQEDAYVAAEDPRRGADLVLVTTGPVGVADPAAAGRSDMSGAAPTLDA